MDLAKQFGCAVSFIKDLKTALELIGWWSPLSGIATGIVWATWATISGLPLSVVVLGAICAIVAVTYLALLPRFVRLLARNHISEKPNYHIFKYTPFLHIRQAACLFADVGWSQGQPFPQVAHDWAHNLGIAVDMGEIRNFTPDLSPATYETKVSVEDLRAYAKRHDITVPFFAYVPHHDVPN